MAALSAANWLRPFALSVSLVLLLVLLYAGRLILIPVALALLFTFLLGPAVVALQRRGLSRVLSTILIVGAALALCAGSGWAIGRQITGLIDAFPKNQSNIQARMASLRAAGPSGLLEKLQGIIQQVAHEFEKKGPTAVRPSSSEGEEPRPVRIIQDPSPFRVSQLWTMAGPLLHLVAAIGLVIVLVIFMLIHREDMRDRLIALIGHGQLTATTHALEEASDRISRYLLMQLILNGTFGVAVGLGLLFMGVPYALLWGFFAAVLRYIPYLGSWVAALLPIALSLLLSDSWTQPILIAVLFVALELPTNFIMEPWLYGRHTGVSEAALLVAVAFWAWLWGPVGLILASPLTVCLIVLGKYVPALGFFNTLLGDRPVLEPPIRYYQRLLARDHDEAVEIAEQQLENSSLESVYDSLLVPALNLAKRDAQADILPEGDHQFVLESTREIAEELARQHRAAKAAESTGSAVSVVTGTNAAEIQIVGCPARDDSDEVSLVMLREILDAKHCKMTVMTAAQLSSEIVGLVEEKRPGMLCIAALPPGGLAHARYLCLRLRARFPELKIVIGRWGVKGSSEKAHEKLLTAGADQIGTTLDETVNHMLQLSQLVPQTTPATEKAPAPGSPAST